MKVSLNNASAEWMLRIFLALTYFYSGFDLFRHPTSWHWAVSSLRDVVEMPIRSLGIDAYLRFQGASEILFATVFLSWFLPRRIVMWVALLTALEMAGVLALGRIDQQTFRDFGILGAALALSILTRQHASSREQTSTT